MLGVKEDPRAPDVLVAGKTGSDESSAGRATICLDRESTCGYTVLMASKNRKVRNQFSVREAHLPARRSRQNANLFLREP